MPAGFRMHELVPEDWHARRGAGVDALVRAAAARPVVLLQPLPIRLQEVACARQGLLQRRLHCGDAGHALLQLQPCKQCVINIRAPSSCAGS